MSQELMIVNLPNPVEIFKKGGSEEILKQIKEKVTSEVFDVSTEKGRDVIRSTARKIASSKTAIDAMGKELKSEWIVIKFKNIKILKKVDINKEL